MADLPPVLPPHLSTPPQEPLPPFDVAVAIQSVLRPALVRAVQSVFEQTLSGRIQILIGIDMPAGDPALLERLIAAAPPHVRIDVLDPGYSTSVRHGGIHPHRCGGTLRTVLGYLAHSRYVAYLDDDNWFAPDHLALLRAPLAQGQAGWSFSLRWFVDPKTHAPLAIDTIESVGPGGGTFAQDFGGWVDPNCLMLDKRVCEPALALFSEPLPNDKTAMTGDRMVFDWLRKHARSARARRPTVFYTLGPDDIRHPVRLRFIEAARAEGTAGTTRPPPARPFADPAL